MSKAKYPIVHAPSAAFMERLAAVQDPEFVVTELEFRQWAKHGRWSAEFRLGQQGNSFTMEIVLGGAEPTLDAIERRVLKWLKKEEKAE